jgi:hypothetical protein
MVQRVSTVAFEGIEARAVDVQVQIVPGLPAFAKVNNIYPHRYYNPPRGRDTRSGRKQLRSQGRPSPNQGPKQSAKHALLVSPADMIDFLEPPVSVSANSRGHELVSLAPKRCLVMSSIDGGRAFT